MNTTATYRFMSIEIPSISMTCSYAAILATDEEMAKMFEVAAAHRIADTSTDWNAEGENGECGVIEYPENWICKSCDLNSADFETEIEYIEAAMEYTADSCWSGRFTAAAMIEAITEGRYPTHH